MDEPRALEPLGRLAVAGALFVPSKDKEVAGVLQKEVPEMWCQEL